MKAKTHLRALFFLILLSALLLPSAAFAGTTMPTLKIDGNAVGMSKAEKKVYKKLKALRATKTFREGRRWTNANGYTTEFRLGGVRWIEAGCGCHGLALKISDKLFGKGARVTRHRKFKSLHVGDLVRVDEDKPTMHTFVVVKTTSKKAVVVEGNYGGRIHWGRVIALSWIKRHGSYVYTRY